MLLALTLLVSMACAGTLTPQTQATPVAQAGEATATPAMPDENVRQPVALVAKSEGGDTDADEADARAEATLELVPEEASDAVVIVLGKAITINSPGATASGNTVNITAGGTYRISGSLTDGQINVNTKDKVTLELAGMSVTNSAGPALYVVDAKKITLKLLPGTTNYLADSAQEQADDAAVVSNDTLVIEGDGALVITGNNGEGIASDDDIIIKGGSITITAVDDGLDVHDNITIGGGHISISAGGDGMKAGQDANPEVGSIAVEGGTIEITAGRDGIQAATTVVVSAGDLTISTGGGSASVTRSTAGDAGRMRPGDWGQQISDTPSAKGIKAVVDLTIAGGAITIDAADDALHSNDSLTVNGGDLVLASGDDAIHADASVTINGGDICITTSYEGIESAIITINDGNIRLVSSDDGINAVSDNAAAGMGGPWGRNPFNESGNNNLYINGGYIVIDANGDGLDINGSIEMTGGQVIINGPTRNDNGALDYLGTFKVTGGLLVAAGSAGMAQAPSTSSTQYSVMVNLAAAQSAGTVFHIAAQDGEVLTFVPTKAYQSVVFSSPELKRGTTYIIYTGGKATGTATDGLYTGGAYTPGTQLTSLTISSAVTVIGSSRSVFPGGRRP